MSSQNAKPQVIPSQYRAPASHSSFAETQPLLGTTKRDVERSSAGNGVRETTSSTAKRNRTSRRGVLTGLGFGAFLAVLITSCFRMYHGRSYHPRVPNEGHQGGVPVLPGNQGEQDGSPLHCATFNSHTPWSAYRDEAHWRSTNVSFLIPLQGAGQIFMHLTGVGSVFLSTYEGSTESPSGSLEETTESAQREQLEGGKDVRIIVEPVYDVLPGVSADEPATVENSPGWEMLLASQICLMRRKASDSAQQHVLETRDMGVGIYTARPAHSVHTNYTSTPLKFRVHVFLPYSSPEVEGHAVPADHVRSLDVRAAVGGIYLSDLSGVRIGVLDLSLGVGDIMFDKVRAEVISAKTTGLMAGRVEVSDALDMHVPTGEIDLDVILASPPQSKDVSLLSRGHQDVCDLPPIAVDVSTSSGDVKLRYVVWEEPRRGLSQDVHTSVGSIEVVAHPLFQGPYYLTTSVGQISVELLDDRTADPTGQGRIRHITVNKSGRLGSREYQGEAKWEKKHQGVQGHDQKSKKRPSHHGRTRENRMDAWTSVGSIKLVF